MCAIAGMLAPSEVSNRLTVLRDHMIHRGPDEGGLLVEKVSGTDFQIGLGHRRLAIRDLSPAGRQPMSDSQGRFTLVYNGEIYNVDELRSKLAAQGITRFKSTGDTELLLQAWATWGDRTPEQLQGEFAFAIWDKVERTLSLCRDRLGIKPLYWSRRRGELAFASELTPLYRAGLVGPGLNPRAIDSYLGFGSVLEPETIYQDGNLLEAGTLLKIDARDLSLSHTRFWENPFRKTQPEETPSLESIEALLRESVQCRLVSDVPLTVFLSGGIDSSSIAAAAGTPLQTVCVYSATHPSADKVEASRVSKALATHHSEVVLSDERFYRCVEGALSAMDQPTADGVNTFAVSQAVHSRGYKVALSGLGGDEFFCGYRTIQRAKYLKALQKAPRFFWAALPALLKLSPGRTQEKLTAFAASAHGIADFYAASRGLFLDDKRALLLNGSTPLNLWVKKAVPWIEEVNDPVNALCALEIEVYLRNTLLRDTDSMGMANSLEIRGPFLDHRLLDLVAKIPGLKKLPKKTNKPLLVQTLGKTLPARSVERNKSGFTFPWDSLLDGVLNDSVRATFSSDYRRTWNELGISLQEVEKVYAGFKQRQPGILWSHVWALFSLAQWQASHRVLVAKAA